MIKIALINEWNRMNLPLAKQIRKNNGIRRSSDEAYSFIITSLKSLYPNITDNQLRNAITDDDPDGEIDAIIFSGKENTISIFDIKSSSGFRYDDIKLFKTNIQLYLFTPRQSLDGLAERPRLKLIEARKFIKKGWKVRIYVIRGCMAKVPTRTEGILKSLRSSCSSVISYKLLDLNSLIKEHLCIKSGQNNYPWKVEITSGNNEADIHADRIIIREQVGGPIKAMLARIRLADIIELQRHFVENKLDLFDANVRNFQKKKEISKKILHSIQNQPDLFHIFHNGLTFTCAKIGFIDFQNYIIINPQVINGCQTVNTLYDTYKDNVNDENLKKATILCRFYALEYNMIEKVCEATNTQVKIDLWDLRANDDIQKILDEALSLKGIKYQRKKSPGRRDVFITDLAQWIYSCKKKKPAEAKNNKTALFGILIKKPPYRSIFNEKIDLEAVVKICEIAFFVKDKIKSISKGEHTFERSASLHFIAALYHVQGKKGTLSEKYKKINKIIKRVVKEIKERYGEDISFNQIFTKKQETWDRIERKLKSI